MSRVIRTLICILISVVVVSCSGGGGGDGDSSGKVLKLNISLVGPVADSEETRDSLQDVVNILQEIYSKANISLDVNWYEFAGEDTIPNPFEGDSFYEEVATTTRSGAVNVVFAIDVDGLRSPDYSFGIPGGNPGPVSPSNQSAVAISILELTGKDGRFDFDGEGGRQIHNDERQLAAEEVGRLVAQYLGLQNIIELRNSRVVATDNLQDTASCLTLTDCRNTEEVRHNLMCPVTLREFDTGGEFFVRDQLTKDQGEVLRNSSLLN